jgi:hypothetical protein
MNSIYYIYMLYIYIYIWKCYISVGVTDLSVKVWWYCGIGWTRLAIYPKSMISHKGIPCKWYIRWIYLAYCQCGRELPDRHVTWRVSTLTMSRVSMTQKFCCQWLLRSTIRCMVGLRKCLRCKRALSKGNPVTMYGHKGHDALGHTWGAGLLKEAMPSTGND